MADVGLWLWRCDAGHLHARAERGGVVYESRVDASALPGDLKDYVPCRDERGRFAPCGGGISAAGHPGKTREEHTARQQEAHGKAQRLVAEMKAGHATPEKMKALAGELSKMTVAQVRALAKEHSLKSPAGRKEDLVNGLAMRFHAAHYREQPPAPPSLPPSAPQPDPLKDRPAPFADGKAADAWGKAAYGRWADKLSEAEAASVEEYKGDSSIINDMLRDPAAKIGTTGYYARHVANLDSALGKTPTDRDVIAYRGMTHPGAIKEITGNVGGVFRDRAYQSTSVAESQAAVFAEETYEGNKAGEGLLMEIHVPRGSRGAYMDARPGPWQGEKEFLLPRDSKIRILSVEKKGDVHHVKGRLEE